MRLDGWIEVFRAGKYPGKREITVADVEAIARNYDAGYHESPAVVGHPATDAPAYAWVAGLKAQGGVLLAKLKQVAPELESMVAAGRFKKRSVAIYPDLDGRGMYLRHIGFLGAEPPAVKGLSPAFAEDGDAGGEVVEIEYEEATKKMTLEEVKKAIAEQLAEFAEAVGLKKKTAGDKPEDASYAEAVKAAKAELKGEYDTRFTEARQKIEGLEAQIAAQRKQAETTGATAFAEAALKSGKLTAATMPLVTALAGMLAGQTETVEFGEGDQKASKTGLALLEQLVDGLPKVVEYSELTAGQGGGGRKGKLVVFNEDARFEADGHELAEKAAAIALEKNIEYGEALKLARVAG